jgi:hypothetical protein
MAITPKNIPQLRMLELADFRPLPVIYMRYMHGKLPGNYLIGIS